MAASIIWYVTVLGSAALFFLIGVYAAHTEKPMWFWSGVEVNAADISDVKQYNLANSRMWKAFSLWFWGSGIAWIWSTTAAVILLIAGCSIGLVTLVAAYRRIEKRYRIR